MTDGTDPSGDGEQPNLTEFSTVQALMDQKSPLWHNAYVENDLQRKETVRSEGRYKTITGNSQSGAEIKATHIDFSREELAHRIKDGIYYTEWVMSDRIQGVGIRLRIPGAPGEHRQLEIFFPDDLPPEGVWGRPIQIKLKSGANEVTVRPAEGQKFDRLWAEAGFYLGEPIDWDEHPTASAFDG